LGIYLINNPKLIVLSILTTGISQNGKILAQTNIAK